MFSKDKDNNVIIIHPSSHLSIDVQLSWRAEIFQFEPGAIFVLVKCYQVCAGVEQLLMME